MIVGTYQGIRRVVGGLRHQDDAIFRRLLVARLRVDAVARNLVGVLNAAGHVRLGPDFRHLSFFGASGQFQIEEKEGWNQSSYPVCLLFAISRCCVSRSRWADVPTWVTLLYQRQRRANLISTVCDAVPLAVLYNKSIDPI